MKKTQQLHRLGPKKLVLELSNVVMVESRKSRFSTNGKYVNESSLNLLYFPTNYITIQVYTYYFEIEYHLNLIKVLNLGCLFIFWLSCVLSFLAGWCLLIRCRWVGIFINIHCNDLWFYCGPMETTQRTCFSATCSFNPIIHAPSASDALFAGHACDWISWQIFKANGTKRTI